MIIYQVKTHSITMLCSFPSFPKATLPRFGPHYCFQTQITIIILPFIELFMCQVAFYKAHKKASGTEWGSDPRQSGSRACVFRHYTKHTLRKKRKSQWENKFYGKPWRTTPNLLTTTGYFHGVVQLKYYWPLWYYPSCY